MSLGVIVKAPDDDANFAVDWKDWLDTDRDGTENDTIASVAWTADSGLTVGTTSNTDTVATAKISGGTAGQSYAVRCQITTTTGGEVFDRFGTLRVSDV